MKLIFMLFALLSSCGDDKNKVRDKSTRDSESIAQSLMLEDSQRLRGYSEINNYLKSNIISNTEFDIALYLEKEARGFEKVLTATRLANNLGSSKSDGMRMTESGSEPNAMNMLLWNIVIESLSSDLSKNCKGEKSIQKIELYTEFKINFDDMCNEEFNESIFEPIYENLLGFYGTESHLSSWRNFQSSYYQDEENKSPIQNVFYTLLYSPEFLVRR